MFVAGKTKYFVCVYRHPKRGNRFIREQRHYSGVFLHIDPSCTSFCLGFVSDLVGNKQVMSTKMFHCVGFGFDLDYITAFLAVVLRALESKERLKVP